ncbi:MAG: carboxypeptidase-like regulatory domain-containing protein, partial [Dysgonamonadaceae bacterium]|nr:carboxypeptidase-like regulatory domain-containing protein [Dysgonamonadaceae bacterium]
MFSYREIFMVFILLTTSTLQAQQRKTDIIFSGQVSDADTKESLPYATIRLDGVTSYFAISDENGEFK